MSNSLNLFPVRCAIGRVALPDEVTPDGSGKMEMEVFMTPEFARALSDLLDRVGGETGLSTDDITTVSTFNDQAAAIGDLQAQLEDLRTQIGLLTMTAAVPPTDYGPDFEINYSFVPPTVDWEHPGKVGAQIPDTGSFTIIKIGAGTVLLPSLYFGSDTTTGLYRTGANTVGLTAAGVNVVTWSATGAAYVQNVNTTKQFVSTIAIGTAPLQVTSTTLVPNLYVARAALADTATVLTTPTTFPANATDLPTVITLANALKAAGVAKGL